jgi:cytochrome b pre-mRNA-processing protein 3
MKRFFARFFAKDEARRSVAALYGAVMAAARRPDLFEKTGLPDRFETRFELLALHMFLILARLKTEGAAGKSIMRALTEYMVDDLDRTLREAGIGDVGVAKRMKKLMSGFYGRVLAYEKALEAGDEKEILRTLDRNLFAEVDTDVAKLETMRGYIFKQRAALAGQALSEFDEGRAPFAVSAL